MVIDETVEVAVVGAGFAGLSAAKAYKQCSPSTNLVILDSNSTIGGTWAQERLYQGLRSNNLRGTLEFPDHPFHDGFGIKQGEHLTGEVVHKYLVEYADRWGIAGRVRCRSKVLVAEKIDDEKKGDGWLLTVQTSERQYKLFTSKLIVATGLTSQPRPMHVRGDESYSAPIIHVGQISNRATEILKDPDTKHVTVVGGSKSAWDAVYMFASADKEVDWVIRENGHGPNWMSVSHITIGPLGKFWLESLVSRRILAWMSPCVWGGLDGSNWWRYLLHRTWLGRKFVETFWSVLSAETLGQSGFDSDPKLRALKPDCGVFETGKSFGILNYPTDALDHIRSGKVKVYRQDLSHLTERAVHLADGTELDSDAFVASTGWVAGPAIDFQPTSLHSDLGIPSQRYTEDQKAFWSDLDEKADVEIFRRYPSLAKLKYPPRVSNELIELPSSSPPQPESHPLRLHRSLVPPGLAAKDDRTLAFAGLSANFTNHIRNELAGLWIYAYLNSRLNVDPYRRHCDKTEDVYWSTALFTRFCFRRHPYGFGAQFPDFVFDSVPWNDLLLKDLGLSGMRKGGSWYRECFEPYEMADYRGVTAEWLGVQPRQVEEEEEKEKEKIS